MNKRRSEKVIMAGAWVHNINDNTTADIDDVWDGHGNLSFDWSESSEGPMQDLELEMQTSNHFTESTWPSRATKDDFLISNGQEARPRIIGLEGRLVNDDEIQSAVGNSSASVSSNHSLASRSIMSHRGRDCRNSGRIAYLDEESISHAKGDIFTVVCTNTTSTSSRPSLDAWTQEERDLREMAASSHNFEPEEDLLYKGKPSEPKPKTPVVSDTISWSPAWEATATKGIFARENRQTSQPSQTSATSDPFLPPTSTSPAFNHEKQDKDWPCQRPSRNKRMLQLWAALPFNARRGGDNDSKESSTESRTYAEDNFSTSNGSDEVLQKWYRATDVPSPHRIDPGDWSILVVSGRGSMEKVETYLVHTSILGVGPHFSEYFRREFQNYAVARRTEAKGAYSIVRLKPDLAHAFPYMLNFIYSASDDGTIENLDRPSLRALRQLGTHFGIAELDKVTGPCNV
jgi:hypothetical protein